MASTTERSHPPAGSRTASPIAERAGAVAGAYPEHFEARLLITDLRIALALTNEARYRMLERWFGIPRGDANLATLVAALILAEAAADKTHQLLSGPGGPTRADALIGVAVVDELVRAIGGPAARGTPQFTTLVGIAMLGGLARPALRQIRPYARRGRASFNLRYGRLIGRSRAIATAPLRDR